MFFLENAELLETTESGTDSMSLNAGRHRLQVQASQANSSIQRSNPIRLHQRLRCSGALSAFTEQMRNEG